MHYQRLALALSLAVLLSACATTPTLPPGATPDTDIAAIVMASHEGEIATGEAGRTRATSEEVRSFAQMLVTDHTAAVNTARDFFNREGVNAASGNATAETLRANTQTTIRNLATYEGAAFDRAFMQAQVDMHQWLLNTLDTALIPSAPSREARELLQTQRGSVAAHLDRARQIHAGLR